MNGSADTDTSSRSGVGPTLGIAAAACVACCIGTILAVPGATIALGVVSTIFIGAAGLLIAAAAITAFVVVRRRRKGAACAPPPEPVPVELGRR